MEFPLRNSSAVPTIVVLGLLPLYLYFHSLFICTSDGVIAGCAIRESEPQSAPGTENYKRAARISKPTGVCRYKLSVVSYHK